MPLSNLASLNITSLVYERKCHIALMGGQFIVRTYVLGACIKSDSYASREKAMIRIGEIKGGIAL